jgi:hypothetical protein
MSTETITLLNFIVHSLVIGGAAWLLVCFVIRDALRRCILANLAVLMCVYSPFDISMRDLFPSQQPVPVWTPLRETFEADWRVTVAPVTSPVVIPAAPAPSWDVNDVVKSLRWLSWLVTAALLLRLLIQSIRVQRWAWRLRELTNDETAFIRDSVLECSSPLELSAGRETFESAGGPAHSKTLSRIRTFDGDGTPCVAGWFFPVIAVPSTAFEKLTPRQWRWLIRHESEHLRCHDTVAVLLQNIVRAFLWWNPFIHGLIEEYARAREEACDAAAVGEDRAHDDYADFLLAWAAKAAPQPSCVMPIAHSRPARRLKARLVALMETRGVRKKVGALFMLGCLAFAGIAPFFAASFGIVTVAAQEAAKADPKDKTMFVRTYRVAPDFLSRSQELRDPFAIQDQKAPVVSEQSIERTTARQVLEKHGITFPPDASAVFNPATSQLIVRNTLANIALADSVIDDLSIRFPQVYLTCQMISADRHYGVHGSVLSGDEAKALIQSVSQKKDIHLLAAPRVTTKFGQRAGIEIVREVLPKVLPDGSLSGDMKLLGPRVFIDMSRPEKGKTTLAAEVEFGINPTSEDPWSLKNAAQADWDKVMLHKIAGQAALASGETLLLQLGTSKKPLTVLLTAQALDPSGKEISSFDGVRPGAGARSQIVAAAAADKQASEWAVRVYQVPAGFAQDKPPLEVLKVAGITFPKAADAMLKDGKLTVRNTKANLELIEAWIDALNKFEVKKSVHLSVLAAEMKGDFLKLLNDWLPPLPGAAKNTEAPTVITEPPPPAVLRQFILSGIFSPPQFAKLMKRLATDDELTKLESLKPNLNPPMYVLPAAMGGQEMKVEPIIGPDGNTIELIIRTPSQDQNPARGISTSVTIWDGQTVVLGSQASEGVSRFLFITGNLIAPLAKK